MRTVLNFMACNHTWKTLNLKQLPETVRKSGFGKGVLQKTDPVMHKYSIVTTIRIVGSCGRMFCLGTREVTRVERYCDHCHDRKTTTCTTIP